MSPIIPKTLQILGTRGIPAQHGGFESFTEDFSLYLQRRGWSVTVYCQEEGNGPIHEDNWRGVHRVRIPVSLKGAIGTIVFDWKSTLLAASKNQPVLTLGYNSAVFCTVYRMRGIKNAINMDGLEWARAKWNRFQRAWLYMNEKAGSLLGNHLIADHPEIKNHLAKFVSAEKITAIPYSADHVESADSELIRQFELEPGRYALLIARPEPENSIIEIVRAYSKTRRGMPLLVLGAYDPETNPYHRRVLDSAGDEVKLIGAIYDKSLVQALRFYTRLYIHGHTVGGTNPSLVEALGAGSPVLAHDNRFNRWVAGAGACYFSSEKQCCEKLDTLMTDDAQIEKMRIFSRTKYIESFTPDKIYSAYESLILDRLT